MRTLTSKAEIEATELRDVDVRGIALVKRGANQVPFSIIKSENGDTAMLNFAKGAFQNFRKAAPESALVAVVVSKKADLELAKAALVERGLSVDPVDAETSADVYIFPQVPAGTDVTGAQLIKMDENVGAMVTGTDLAKAFEGVNFESESFKEVMAQEGFRPGIGIAMDVLHGTISNILQKAESVDGMAESIEKAVDEFKSFAVGMAKAVPTAAFSVDMFKADLTPAAKTDADAERVAREAATEKARADETAKAEARAEADAKARAEKTDDADAADDTGSAVASALAKLSEQLAGLGQAVEAVKTENAESARQFGERLDKTDAAVTAAAKKAASRVGGTPEDDAVEQAKSAGRIMNGAGEPRLVDTAYMTKAEKEAL